VSGVRRAYREVGRDCRYTFRALVLVASPDEDVSDAAESWLLSADDGTADALETWGLPARLKKPQEVAGEISRLLAITGPPCLRWIRSTRSSLRREHRRASRSIWPPIWVTGRCSCAKY